MNFLNKSFCPRFFEFFGEMFHINIVTNKKRYGKQI